MKSYGERRCTRCPMELQRPRRAKASSTDLRDSPGDAIGDRARAPIPSVVAGARLAPRAHRSLTNWRRAFDHVAAGVIDAARGVRTMIDTVLHGRAPGPTLPPIVCRFIRDRPVGFDRLTEAVRAGMNGYVRPELAASHRADIGRPRGRPWGDERSALGCSPEWSSASWAAKRYPRGRPRDGSSHA